MKLAILILYVAFAAIGCKKSSPITPVTPIIPIMPTVSSCKIAADTSNLVGNYSVNKYALNAQGDPEIIERFVAGGVKQFTKKITYLSPGVIKKIVTTSGGGATEVTYNYASTDPLPTDATVNFDGKLVWSYLF